MKITADQNRDLGDTGLRVPPIGFGICALGNGRRVIPEQTKLAICGEWFRQVEPPVFIDTSWPDGDGLALQSLVRAFQRLDVAPGEVVLSVRLKANIKRMGYDAVLASWDEACELLGGNHRPRLVAVDAPDDYLATARSPADRDQRMGDILGAYRALDELKADALVAGVGVAARDWTVVREIESAARLDWVMFVGSFTILRHPTELLAYLADLASRQIAVVQAGVLAGGGYIDERAANQVNADERSLLTWRKSFAALCHGHGITPAHACIQFALAAPGVAAVAVNTSHLDRIAQNVESTVVKVPEAFWAAIKEEGLLAMDFPCVG